MRRVVVWVVALFLGSLAASAVSASVPGSAGWPGVAFLATSMLVFAFVTVSVVTAVETLFPSLRVSRRSRPRSRPTAAGAE